MLFSNPIWLWGLTALTVPVAVHLLSRKQSAVLKLGSLRHLQASVTKQSVNIRLNEWVLLALRCLMIILIVLLLSGLHFTTQRKAQQRWLLIESGLETDPGFTHLIDSLKRTGFELKQLHAGFGDDPAPSTDSIVNYWKLAEQIQRHDPEQVVVLSNSQMKKFKGKRVSKPRQLTWISKDPEPHQFALQAIRFNKDSVTLRSGSADGNNTRFNSTSILLTKMPDSVALDRRDTVELILASDKIFEYDEKVMLASLRSLDDKNLPALIIRPITTDVTQPLTADWLLWLSDKPLPQDVNANTLVMAPASRQDARLLSQEKDCHSDYVCWTITRRLTVDEAVRHKLAFALSTLLSEHTRANLGHLANMNDRRVQPETMMWSEMPPVADRDNILASGPSTRLPWLAAMLLGVLLIERLLAFRRDQ